MGTGRGRGTGRTSSRTRAPKVFKIVGPSGVGKTTLAERLIHDWTKSGLRVGYLKHASHGFDLDRPGKDSERAMRAGAEGVALLGPGRIAFLEVSGEARVEELARRLFSNYDVVVVEGFSMSPLPAVWFAGARSGRAGKALPEGEVIAVVTAGARDGDRRRSPPSVKRTAIGRIRALVERHLRLHAEKG